jgi:hypothetical protein
LRASFGLWYRSGHAVAGRWFFEQSWRLALTFGA